MIKRIAFKGAALFISAAILLSSSVFDVLNLSKAYAAVSPVVTTGSVESFDLPFLRGVKFDPSNPFELNFVIDQGTQESSSDQEQNKLLRYFLGALTIPEDKLWVNLSPYESDRIIDQTVAKTEIGEVLLEQDYLLKQLAASYTHPDTLTGKKYWSGLTAAQDAAGDLSKIWIKPGHISLYDKNNVVFISDLTFTLESGSSAQSVLVSALKDRVNNGAEFASLRQMVYSIILAQWFKRKFTDSLYSFYYNTEKVDGIDIIDPSLKQEVFERYVSAFEKGAYNVTRKERDPVTSRLKKRQYFSGGILPGVADSAVTLLEDNKPVLDAAAANNLIGRAARSVVAGEPSLVSSQIVYDSVTGEFGRDGADASDADIDALAPVKVRIMYTEEDLLAMSDKHLDYWWDKGVIAKRENFRKRIERLFKFIKDDFFASERRKRCSEQQWKDSVLNEIQSLIMLKNELAECAGMDSKGYTLCELDRILMSRRSRIKVDSELREHEELLTKVMDIKTTMSRASDNFHKNILKQRAENIRQAQQRAMEKSLKEERNRSMNRIIAIAGALVFVVLAVLGVAFYTLSNVNKVQKVEIVSSNGLQTKVEDPNALLRQKLEKKYQKYTQKILEHPGPAKVWSDYVSFAARYELSKKDTDIVIDWKRARELFNAFKDAVAYAARRIPYDDDVEGWETSYVRTASAAKASMLLFDKFEKVNKKATNELDAQGERFIDGSYQGMSDIYDSVLRQHIRTTNKRNGDSLSNSSLPEDTGIFLQAGTPGSSALVVNGGIDLKDMFAGIDVSASSSAVTVSPEQAAGINGLMMTFVTGPQALNINEFLAAPGR